MRDRCQVFAAFLLATQLAASASQLLPVNQSEANSGWAVALPEEVGLDSVALAEMFDCVRNSHLRVHSVQIARHGRLALDAYFYPYSVELRHDVASVTKSITSTLVGL